MHVPDGQNSPAPSLPDHADDVVSLSASTRRSASPGPADLEDIVVRIEGPTGEPCRSGPYHDAHVHLMAPAADHLEGRKERQAFRGTATFRGLRALTPGVHVLRFTIHPHPSQGDPETLCSAPLRISVAAGAADGVHAAAVEPDFPYPIQTLR